MYQELNHRLRSGQLSGKYNADQLDFYKNAILEAFDQIPNADVPTVYRGEDYINGWIDNLLVGTEHSWKQFLSTSEKRNHAHQKKVQFVIQRKPAGFKGIRLEPITSVPEEDEILFPPGFRFRVTHRERKEGIIHIYVVEL